MGKVKEVITNGLELLDEAYEHKEVAKNKLVAIDYIESLAFYHGCVAMFEKLTPGFEVEVVDRHHELKGV